ncbi:hypothetical protein BKA80DRAFT_79051 [Phyllosticta citrichinensis]
MRTASACTHVYMCVQAGTRRCDTSDTRRYQVARHDHSSSMFLLGLHIAEGEGYLNVCLPLLYVCTAPTYLGSQQPLHSINAHQCDDIIPTLAHRLFLGEALPTYPCLFTDSEREKAVCCSAGTLVCWHSLAAPPADPGWPRVPCVQRYYAAQDQPCWARASLPVCLVSCTFLLSSSYSPSAGLAYVRVRWLTYSHASVAVHYPCLRVFSMLPLSLPIPIFMLLQHAC